MKSVRALVLQYMTLSKIVYSIIKVSLSLKIFGNINN